MDDDRCITSLGEVPDAGTLLFTVSGDDGLEEVILTRLGGDGDVVAFKNYCQHWTDIRLDKGSGARVTNGEIWCQKHGATFEKESGYCNFGPCEGSYLSPVDVEVVDDTVYLATDDYTFEHRGPAGEYDRSSGNRIGFSG